MEGLWLEKKSQWKKEHTVWHSRKEQNSGDNKRLGISRVKDGEGSNRTLRTFRAFKHFLKL